MNVEQIVSELEKKIGYVFKNKQYAVRALSHSSYANENRKLHIASNERLEFLGDSVLSIIVSEYIFKHYTNLPEGELTRMRASLVCEKSLCAYSRQIKLGDFLFLGKGEQQNGGSQRDSILADSFEALLAAIYLDGGIESASKHVFRFIEKDLEDNAGSFTDYKTVLQEIIQRNPEELLYYELREESGPGHEKQFTVDVMLNSNMIGTGVGHSKKDAEQQAAKQALILMGHNI